MKFRKITFLSARWATPIYPEIPVFTEIRLQTKYFDLETKFRATETFFRIYGSLKFHFGQISQIAFQYIEIEGSTRSEKNRIWKKNFSNEFLSYKCVKY